MDRQSKAYIYALLTVAIWSTVASAFKLSLRYLTPLELMVYSVFFSCLALFSVIVVQGKLKILWQSQLSDWKSGVLFGLLNPCMYYLVLFKCYDLLPAQQAQTINLTWAIMLALLAVPFLGHRLSKRDLWAIFISYFGVYVISTKGQLFSFSFSSPLGVLLALGSTILWSLYWIFNTRDKRDPVIGLCINFICSFPLVVMYLYFTEGFRLVSFYGIIGALYIGCFEMGFSFIFWLLAMKHTRSAARITNLIFLAPFISLVLIHVLVGEEIFTSSIVGLIVIVIGLIIQSRNRSTE